VSVNELIPL